MVTGKGRLTSVDHNSLRSKLIEQEDPDQETGDLKETSRKLFMRTWARMPTKLIF